ncbi:MAG: TetR/AcrR family transcriptional regulator [Rhizobiaceae bacterium]|nr:TetR/AcrR family transcriptional regulator [Rhizobiaceae bacterium]
MPRPKTRSDAEVLEAALALIYATGPDALTFQSLSAACGLSAATLVQRFGTKSKLKQAALLMAWDRLDADTSRLAETLPKTPAGAIRLLTALSKSYGGIEKYAEGLLVLREDFRDPVLRARGAAWKVALSAVLDECFRDAPGTPRGVGLLLASQWQGCLLWWGFDGKGDADRYVQWHLKRFVGTVTR